MHPTLKLAAFAATLATAFGLGLGVGALAGPLGDDPAPARAEEVHGEHWHP